MQKKRLDKAGSGHLTGKGGSAPTPLRFPRFTGARLILAIAVALGSLYLLRHPILRGVGDALTHVDTVAPSDVIVILSGDADTRPAYAASLFRQDVAPRVALPQEQLTPTAQLGLAPTHTDIALEVLRLNGVPDTAIALLATDKPVTSTRDEAVAIREYVEEMGFRRLVVVTSPFHTARARYTLRRSLEGLPVTVRMAAAPQWSYDTERWWESEAGITAYGMEVLKWIHTLGVLR